MRNWNGFVKCEGRKILNYESLEANFQRIEEHYGFKIEPSKKNLEKIRNHEIDFGGKEHLVADIVKEEMINTYLQVQ